MIGSNIFFSRIVASTLDLWTATLNAGPVLANTNPVLTTTDYNETSPVISEDGACLAYLAGDLAINYGPNSDLWIRDVATGQTQQITQTRDLAGVVWKP
jgi:Tol biopolymer transport system component